MSFDFADQGKGEEIRVCAECLLPLDGDEGEMEVGEALTVTLGVICAVCAGQGPDELRAPAA